MLTHIHIRDFVIVDHLDLPIAQSMTALTGETGAGKSILIDALGLALGDRGDAGWIRHGCDKAEITLSFDLRQTPLAQAWLIERDLDADGEAHIRRIIGADGRSRGYINGHPNPMTALRELGELLVEIHGQHEHQTLLRRDAQRRLLDAHAELGTDLTELAALFQQWRETANRLQTLRDNAAERAERLDLLRFQTGELAALELREGEAVELDQEHARLANAGRLIDNARAILERLYDAEQGSAHSLLSAALRTLQDLADTDAKLQPIAQSLENARIQTDEAAAELRRYLDKLDLDPTRLNEIEQRLGVLHDLARKHRTTPEQLPDKYTALNAEQKTLENADEHLDQLQTQVQTLEALYRAKAETVRQIRKKTAAQLSADVTALMQDLGMDGGRLQIHIDAPQNAQPTAHGLDQIEFHVTANPGQPLRPLRKIASGGELSRISLAIQVVSAKAVRIPTLLFDEVDAGIGGAVAEVVGRLLRRLGADRQILCVTHLPQVAAQAHEHLHIAKTKAKTHTRTHIRSLNGKTRTHEIARMLGGVELTPQTLAHAREMIQRATKPWPTNTPKSPQNSTPSSKNNGSSSSPPP